MCSLLKPMVHAEEVAPLTLVKQNPRIELACECDIRFIF